MIENIETETSINSNILTTIEVARGEKSSRLQFLASPENGHKVSFVRDNGFANGYSRILERWAEDPKDLTDGRAGYPLEIFYRELLSRMFSDQTVCLSPSSLDIKKVRVVQSADIVICEQIQENLYNPLLLISSKLSSGEKSTINPILNTPEVTLNGKKVFGKKDNTFNLLREFAFTEDVESFLQDILSTYTPKITETILRGLEKINQRNIFADNGEKLWIKNRVVDIKIEQLKEILCA